MLIFEKIIHLKMSDKKRKMLSRMSFEISRELLNITNAKTFLFNSNSNFRNFFFISFFRFLTEFILTVIKRDLMKFIRDYFEKPNLNRDRENKFKNSRELKNFDKSIK